MAVIRNLVVKIAADISSLSKGLQTAQKQIQKVAAGFTKAGTKLTASITAPLVALGATAVNVSQQFEQSMANAASVAGATGDDLQRMTDLAREMGSKTVFSASQAADAMYYMASAGYKVDQMADSIQATLNLASATQSDLAFTTDTVISALNQFGLEASSAERVTNVYAAAIGASMASMDKLSNSMGYVGPVANSLGWEIEEVTGALSVLYNAGYDGSTAGTSLRQSLVALMNPTSAAIKVFNDLGINLEDLDPVSNDLASILDTLSDAGMTTAQAMEVFGARAGPGMLALMSAGGDAVRDMTEAITGTNKANEMAEIQLDTLQGQWKILKSELEEIAIMFGDVLIPIIRQLITKYISPLTAKIMGLSTGTRKNVVVIALLAAAIGPLLMLIGKLISSIGTIAKVASFLFSKVGLIIAIIAAVIGVLVYFWKTNEDFRNAVMKIWEKIKTFVLKAVEAIKEWWDKNGDKIIAQVKAALKALWNIVKKIFNKVWDIAKKIWPVVKKIVIDTVQAIKNFWDKYGASIMNTVKTVFTTIWNLICSALDIIISAVEKFLTYLEPIWENIKQLFASLWDTIVNLYETLKPIFDLIIGIVMTLWGVVSSVVSGIIQALGPLIQAVIDVGQAVLDIIKVICALLRGDWAEAWEYMKSFAINIWDAIKNVFIGIWEFIKGFGESIGKFFGDVGDTIVGVFKSCWEGISGFFVKLWEGICDVCTWVWDKICGLFSSIGDFFSNLFKEAFNWGKNLIENIWQGIQDAWNWVVDGVKSIGQAIADFLGFGSPTKKGPCHTADEWIPNLMEMMADGMYADIPDIQKAATDVAQSIAISGSPNRAMVGAGTSPNGEMLNGLLQAMTAMGGMNSNEGGEVVLEIDGQRFARLIMPKLNKEYRRNGIVLQEG